MRVRIKWHDYRLKVLFDVLECFSRSRAIAVDKWLLAKGCAKQGLEMTADDVLPQVVQDF